MSLLIASEISIGVFALIATGLFLNPMAIFHRQVWQAFIAWLRLFPQRGQEGRHHQGNHLHVCWCMDRDGLGEADRPALRVRQLRSAGGRRHSQRRDSVNCVHSADIDDSIDSLWLRKRLRSDPAQQGHNACERDRADYRIDHHWRLLRLTVGIRWRQARNKLIVVPAKIAP